MTSMQTKSAHVRGDRLNPGRASRYFWVLTQLRERYRDTIHRYLASRSQYKVIDYGCGNMPYRPLFEKAEYLGADFPGNEQCHLLISDSGCIDVESHTADVVLSSQVLEHVADVPRYLQESHRVLKPDGYLFLSTHGVWKYHPDPCDYWRWTCDGLRKIVSDNGFEVVELTGVMGPEATALQLLLDARMNRASKWYRKAYVWYMQNKIRKADLRCSDEKRNRDACVYMLIAKPRA